MPSVRGRLRATVITLFVASGTIAGGLVGLLAGLIGRIAGDLLGPRRLLPLAGDLRGLDDLLGLSGEGALLLGIIAVGLVLDLVATLTGRARPPSVGRQVPREWGRLLPAPAVAVLYGARLGVGPLTILSTWGWWSSTLVAAVIGMIPAMMVGALFGFVRLGVTVGVSLWASRSGDARAFIRLRLGQRPGWLTLNWFGFVAVAALVVAGCSSPPHQPESAKGPLQHRAITSPATIGHPADSESITSAAIGEPLIEPTGPTPLVTTPAQLEDFVRPVKLDTRPLDRPSTVSSAPAELSAALLSTIEGFELIDDAGANRYLDLLAAAEIQPDPTEEVALLETRGFEGGWTRAFRSTANDVAVMSVYHFEDAAEAEFYLEDGLITIGGYGGRFFDIEGLPGVRGFTQSFIDDGDPVMTLGAAFQLGPRWFLVYLLGAPERVSADGLIPLVLALQGSATASPDTME